MAEALGRLVLLFLGPRVEANRLGLAQRLLWRAHLLQPRYAFPLPLSELALPLGLRAKASVTAPEGFAAASARRDCLWQVASRHGHSPMAPPEGHLLLKFTIARACGLRPPSRPWWKPKRPPKVMKVLEQGHGRKKKKSHISSILISSKVQNGFKGGRTFRSRCRQGQTP